MGKILHWQPPLAHEPKTIRLVCIHVCHHVCIIAIISVILHVRVIWSMSTKHFLCSRCPADQPEKAEEIREGVSHPEGAAGATGGPHREI